MNSDQIDVLASNHCRDLAAAKEAILAACVRYNQVGKLSGSTVIEVRFSGSDGQTEVIDISKSNEIIRDSPGGFGGCAYIDGSGRVVWHDPERDKPDSCDLPQRGQDWA